MAKYCSNCGSLVDEGVAFCASCGMKMPSPVASQSIPSVAFPTASTSPFPGPELPGAPSVSQPQAMDASVVPFPEGPTRAYGSPAAAHAARFHQAAEQYRMLLAQWQRGELDPAAFEQGFVYL